jgi:transcriptional regulator with PAS, ATPase and Fis domain
MGPTVRAAVADFSRMRDIAPHLVGVSESIRQLDEELQQAARSDAKILITGESGVGKEIAARLVHEHSSRQSRAFVAINCAGVPDSLLESELFGHVRGSFTGAYRDKPGMFEQAHGGTIFMDEVGEMSLRMQALLLRFLEDGDIYRVGAERRTGTVNVRVVSATNRVLLDRIAEGSFREDLYYRLNVIHVVIPPLRDRREDVAPLLDFFLRQFADKYKTTAPAVPADVLDILTSHDWPGNVRELKNIAERLIVRRGGGIITVDDLSPALRGPVAMASAAGSGRPGARPSGGSASRGAADEIIERIMLRGESFWSAVYQPFMARDLTREEVRTIVKAGLHQTRGNYKMLLPLFNMEPGDYKRFLNFLRKHQCHMPFQQFRTTEVIKPIAETASAGASRT